MRLLSGIAVAALALSVGCANRTSTATTPAPAGPTTTGAAGGTTTATTGGAQTGGAQTGGGAQAGGRAGGAAQGGGTGAQGATGAGTQAAGRGGAQAGAAQAGSGAGAQAAARLTEQDLDGRMKSIQTTLGSIRTKMTNNQVAAVASDAQQLSTLFADVERFFAQNNKQDAVLLAQQARQGATDLAGAAAAGDATKASAASMAVNGTCRQCHAAYREGDAQTGYRVKAGTVTP